MTHFQNNLIALMNAREKLSSDAVDVRNGDQDCNTVLDEYLDQLDEIVTEFVHIHETLLRQEQLIKKLSEAEL